MPQIPCDFSQPPFSPTNVNPPPQILTTSTKGPITVPGAPVLKKLKNNLNKYTMSFTSTATGVAPTSLNLNMFEKLEEKKPKSPSVLTDDEDIFSLDMVTMDMEFDQAYLMYTQMQQKQALSGVEQLQRAKQSQKHQQQQHHQHHHQPQQQQQLAHHNQHNQHNQQNVYGFYPELNDYDSVPGLPLLLPPSESKGLFDGQKTANPMTKDDSMDHFFLNTELNALEKFLDNLALSSGNPLELYNNPQAPPLPSMYNQPMHTMDRLRKPDNREIPDFVKKEITDAFRHPPVQSLKSFGSEQTQLPTPLDSRQLLALEKRTLTQLELDSPPWLPSSKKRRKSSTRPLLTLEQKRLNHSHSEQKRRLLCKQAYERCLRLITNVDDYKNDLVSASAVTLLKKKSKRKQINKDGLPNLSKHTALLKVSGEIMKISGKNEELRKLLAQY